MKATTYYEKGGSGWFASFESWSGKIRYLSQFPNFGQVSVIETHRPPEGVREFCRQARLNGLRPESQVPHRDRVTVCG